MALIYPLNPLTVPTYLEDKVECKVPYDKNSIINLIANDPHLSEFYELIKVAKLEEKLNCSDNRFTIFVPYNEAFKNLSCDVDLTDILYAKNIVNSLILPRMFNQKGLLMNESSSYHTLNQPNRINITTYYDKILINHSASIIHDDIVADNGIIHVISHLVLPGIIV